jgi:hypothetical protein
MSGQGLTQLVAPGGAVQYFTCLSGGWDDEAAGVAGEAAALLYLPLPRLLSGKLCSALLSAC